MLTGGMGRGVRGGAAAGCRRSAAGPQPLSQHNGSRRALRACCLRCQPGRVRRRRANARSTRWGGKAAGCTCILASGETTAATLAASGTGRPPASADGPRSLSPVPADGASVGDHHPQRPALVVLMVAVVRASRQPQLRQAADGQSADRPDSLQVPLTLSFQGRPRPATTRPPGNRPHPRTPNCRRLNPEVRFSKLQPKHVRPRKY